MTSIGQSARTPALGAALELPGRGSDGRLFKRAARGDTSAFEAIFERYHQDLFRYCQSILRSADDAQDALQSTMVSALRSLPGESREVALRPWLFRVAHNHAISILRARRTSSEEVPEELADPRPDADLETRSRLRRLLADLNGLAERHRAALTMRELSGLEFREIGTVLGTSEQAARQLVYEARRSLQEFEAGREMLCEEVCIQLSGGDRRTARSRRLRAHLRDCAACRDFREAIDRRGSDLAALSPPLPALAAAGMLQALLAGGAGASGAGIGAGAAGAAIAGKGLGASLALKAAASVAAVTAIGVGAADLSGVAETPLLGDGERPPSIQRDPLAPLTGPQAGAGSPPAIEALRRQLERQAVAEPGAGTRRGPGAGLDVGKPASAGASRSDGPPSPGPPSHANAGGTPAQGTPGTSAPGPPAHSNAGGSAESNPAPAPPPHASAGGSSAEHSQAPTAPPVDLPDPAADPPGPPAHSNADSRAGPGATSASSPGATSADSPN